MGSRLRGNDRGTPFPFVVIPGRCPAANPEPMNTDGAGLAKVPVHGVPAFAGMTKENLPRRRAGLSAEARSGEPGRDEEEARVGEEDLAVGLRPVFPGQQRRVAVEEAWALGL